MSAAALAGFGRMNNDVVGLRGLPESAAGMTELSADFQTSFLSQRASALDLLPRQVERGRQA